MSGGCLQDRGELEPQRRGTKRRPEDRPRNHTEAKAELPAKRNRAALKRAEGPLMIHSFNKYFLSTYPHARHCAKAEDLTLRKTGKVPVPLVLTVLWGRQ